MNAIILARVSTQEQEEGHSIDAQIKRLQEYAERKGLKVIKTCRIVESSTRGDRKEFTEMIEFIKSQKETTALIADAVDRVQRSFKESVLLDDLRRVEKVAMHFLREGIVLDKEAKSSDIMMWDFAVMGAKTYVLNISDNVKRTLDFKLRKGEWIGKAPVGYMEELDSETGKVNKVLDPVRASLVRLTFELYSTGNYSLRQLAKEMRKRGLTSNTPKATPITRTSIEHILQNPFYYGEMRVKGQLYKHYYEQIITKWLFDKCDDVRQSWHKKPFKHGSKPFTFRGLIKCAFCDCTVTSDRKKDKYTYLRCTGHRGDCGAIRVNEDVITEQVRDVLKTLVMPEDTLAEYKEFLRNSNESEYKFHQAIIDEARQTIDKITFRKKEAYNDKLDKRITADEYDNLCKEWDIKTAEAEQDIIEHSKAHKKFEIALSTLLDVASRANELFEISKPEQKRQLINFIFSNLKLEGKKLVFNLKMPFDQMALLSKSQNWLRGSDSNRQPTGYTYPNVSKRGGLYLCPIDST